MDMVNRPDSRCQGLIGGKARGNSSAQKGKKEEKRKEGLANYKTYKGLY